MSSAACACGESDDTHKRTVLQVVLTTIEPRSHGTGTYDAYEYVVHSHQYITDDIPAARFSYELSPIQVRSVVSVRESMSSVVMCAKNVTPCGSLSCRGTQQLATLLLVYCLPH